MLGYGTIGQLTIGQIAAGGAAEFIGPDKYMQRLSEPVRFRAGLAAPSQAFLAFNPNPVVSFSWFGALADPVRQPPRSPAAIYPSFFFQPAPSPFVATGWFEALSEPVRVKPGLKPAQQHFFSYVANPTTVTPFAWFSGLSTPVRFKPGLTPSRQQFFAGDTQAIPITRISPWFAPLSEPVRHRPGLIAALQQFFAAPPQLRPTPAISAVLAATETPDVFLAGVVIWNTVDTGEVGVIVSTAPDEVGVSALNGQPPIASVAISISII